MVGRVLLLPIMVIFGMQWAQAHQPHEGRDNAIVEVAPPTCTPPVQGTLPGGVIIMRKGAFVEVRNIRVIGEALDQTLGNGPTLHTVIAFCA